MSQLTILGKTFEEIITEKAIIKRVEEMAGQINSDFRGREIIFLGILNGAFVFAADLMRNIDLNIRISFIKLASYDGTQSAGSVRELIGWNENIKGKVVIVIEDIIDTGNTLEGIIDDLDKREAAETRIATLLFKPATCLKNIHPEYIGFEIPDYYVVGYGLDYKGYGRNLTSIYKLV